jgi:type II secretory pathway predicted ATPase ExeA
MYKEFFGLRESAFNVSPDPRYFFLTPVMQEALAGLAYGVQKRKGIILLTGEVGTGKTTLLNQLMDWLRQNGAATAFIFNSLLNVEDLFNYILTDFGISCQSRAKSDMLIRLNNWLLDRCFAGDPEPAVLIIDEAQNLSAELLEEIRLLTNLETSSEKLLQIVLSGQPELEVKLRDSKLRQLRQRITLRYRTCQFSPSETRSYIEERLRIAGASGGPIFSPEAIESIHHYSRGVPRVINVLCDHALINAFAERQNLVSARLIDEVAREFELDLVEPIDRPFSSGLPEGEAAVMLQAMLAAMAKAAGSFSSTESLLKDFSRREGDKAPAVAAWAESGETKI